MAFGGLMLSHGRDQRFVVMTAASDGDLKAIHHRQPLVLPTNSWQQWLTGTASDARQLCVAQSSTCFNWYRVGASVGRVTEDHPELVTPLDEAALAAELRITAASTPPKQATDFADLNSVEMPEHKRTRTAIGAPRFPQLLHFAGFRTDIERL